MLKPLSMLVKASKNRLGLERDLPQDLRKLALFGDLTEREERSLRGAVINRGFQAGEDVFREGVPGLGMYVVAKGEVEILKGHPERRVALLGPGEFFGEIALINEVTRMASARARVESELLLLYQPAFYELIERHPRLGVKLLLAIARVVGVRQIETGQALDALARRQEDA